MPKYAIQPQWRSRKAAIGKKAELDCELLMESEIAMDTATFIASPTSVATVHFTEVPEMKPLPGAWVKVGKGGRPVKVGLMYEPPTKAQAKQKKKRIRASKEFTEDEASPFEEHLAALESACLNALGRSSRQHQKEVLNAKEVKYWGRYKQAKQLKVLQRDTLIASLAERGMLSGESYEANAKTPEPLKRRNDKGSSRGAKLRRKARRASAAARCYPVEGEEEELELSSESPPCPPCVKEQKDSPDEQGGRAAAEEPTVPTAAEVTSRKRPSWRRDEQGKADGKRRSKQCSFM